jgi:hypothetical protein
MNAEKEANSQVDEKSLDPFSTDGEKPLCPYISV